MTARHVAAEFNVPIFSMLTADLSGRYDNYSAAGNSQGKVTYKIGLEFRPIDTLLFRGNYATAFRAPDMGYVFSTGSSFFTSVDDIYNCRKAQGDNYTNCVPPFNSVQIQGFQNGNRALKYITAKSFGYGRGLVADQQFQRQGRLLPRQDRQRGSQLQPADDSDKEADCRLATPRVASRSTSIPPTCQQFIAEVGRNPLTARSTRVRSTACTTVPINICE